jgi:hypothetical protein
MLSRELLNSSKKVGLVLAVAVAAFVCVPVLAVGQNPTCHSIIPVCVAANPSEEQAGCLPIPTSLRPVSLFPDSYDGWDGTGTCGTMPCYLLFRCPCGAPLSSAVCSDSLGGPGGPLCDPTFDPTCGCDPLSDPTCGGFGDPWPPCGIDGSLCYNSIGRPATRAAKGCYHNPQCEQGSRCEALVNSLLAPELPQTASTISPRTTELYLPAGQRESAALYSGALDRLRSFYQGLASIELDATVWIGLPGRSGHGTLHYATSGDKYHLRAASDRELGLSFDVEMAYDLEKHQLLNTSMSTLSLYSRAPSYLPAPFPNPLFLPVAFLGFSDESCGGCQPTVSDVATRWQSRMGSAFVAHEDASRGPLIVEGTKLQGEPFFYRVYFAGNDRPVVSRIDLVRPSGRVIDQVVLQDYRVVEGGALFPHYLAVTGLSEDGKPLASVHFTIDCLRLNGPVPDQFTLGFTQARIVIDEDSHTFLKHPSLNKGAAVRPERN